MTVRPWRTTSAIDVRARRAERGADADLAPPLRHVVGQDAVEAGRGEREREHRERGEDGSRESRLLTDADTWFASVPDSPSAAVGSTSRTIDAQDRHERAPDRRASGRRR